MKKTVLITLALLCGVGTVRANGRAAADTTSGRDRLDAIENLAENVKEKKSKGKDHDKLFAFNNLRFGCGDILVDGPDWFDARKNRSEDIWFTAVEMDVNATRWLSLDLSLNPKWSRLFAGDGKYLYMDADRNFSCTGADLVKDPSLEYKKFESHINVFSLAVPVALDVHFGEFSARLGGEFAVPLSAAAISKVKYDNEKHRSRLSGGKVAGWYYDIFAEILYTDVGIYVRYCPVELIPGTGMSHTEIGVTFTL
mgnify:FL=1